MLVAATWPAVGSALPLQAQDARAVIEMASERHEALDGFCADFAQVIELRLLNETVRASGELCQARSDRFDMRMTDPAGDRIVADGTFLWVYFPSTDDGMVSRTGAAGGSFDLHREFLSDPGERYDATSEGMDEVGGRLVHVVRLRPRVPSAYVEAIVWIDAETHLIRKLQVEDDSERIRTVELSSIRLNPTLPDDRFVFVPPAGVQVITR